MKVARVALQKKKKKNQTFDRYVNLVFRLTTNTQNYIITLFKLNVWKT